MKRDLKKDNVALLSFVREHQPINTNAAFAGMHATTDVLFGSFKKRLRYLRYEGLLFNSGSTRGGIWSLTDAALVALDGQGACGPARPIDAAPHTPKPSKSVQKCASPGLRVPSPSYDVMRAPLYRPAPSHAVQRVDALDHLAHPSVLFGRRVAHFSTPCDSEQTT